MPNTRHDGMRVNCADLLNFALKIICSFSAMIGVICEKITLRVVVDFGCGLAALVV